MCSSTLIKFAERATRTARADSRLAGDGERQSGWVSVSLSGESRPAWSLRAREVTGDTHTHVHDTAHDTARTSHDAHVRTRHVIYR